MIVAGARLFLFAATILSLKQISLTVASPTPTTVNNGGYSVVPLSAVQKWIKEK
jgi:hypothetical protein